MHVTASPSPEGREKAETLLGKGVEELSVANVVAPAVVTTPEGEPLMLAARLSVDDLAAVRAGFMAYPMDTTVRSLGVRNRSRVFGYGARHVVMQRNGCRECSGGQDAPEAHARITAAALVLRSMMRDALPEVAARDEARATAVRDDWRMRGTQWTSGVLNHTSPLPYHYDRNNLEPVWSAMIVARRGVRGGYLHVPELDLTVECRDGDVVFFPGWQFVHGVTPLHKTARDGYRFTAVYYAVAGMTACLDPEAEMAQARQARTAREEDTRPNSERLSQRDAIRKKRPGARGGIAQDWRRNPRLSG